jgi:hypothetical protein
MRSLACLGIVVEAHDPKKMARGTWTGAPWPLFRLADRQGLPRALHLLRQVDVCHYDSDKSYAGRMWAAPLLWSALRPGGYFISDDIDDNLAFRHFADQCGVAPLIVRVGGKFVGVLVKPTA